MPKYIDFELDLQKSNIQEPDADILSGSAYPYCGSVFIACDRTDYTCP